MPVIRLLRTPLVLDAGLAALLVGASLLVGQRVFFAEAEQVKAGELFGSAAIFREHVTWWWLATIPAIAAILMRGRWPLLAFVVAGGSALAHAADLKLWLIGLQLLPIDLAALITLHTLASVTRLRRTGLIALVCAVVTYYLAMLIALNNVTAFGRRIAVLTFGDPTVGFTDTLNGALLFTSLPALLLATGWAVGDNVRTHRVRRTESERRVVEARRDQEQRAALAVAGERARITRELHDVVAHGMSVMVVQAQAAEAALRTEPDTAATALSHVIETGRASLAEMRRLLQVARHASESGLQLAPQPGVNALPGLIDQVRDAGTPVTLRVEGEPVPLPAAVDLSAYRIVQEALTNTRRHAGGGARATVRLVYRSAQVEIDVADDGEGTRAGANHRGNGLRGIAERVGALGGAVDIGPRAGGGYGVRAVLPTGAPE